MVLIWAFSLISLLFGFDTPQYSRDKTISENEEYLYQWTNKLKNGTAFNNLCFSDGTCMTSAGVGSISVYTNPNYLTGSGILASPLSVNSDNVTIQGNTFNSANKLLQLDGAGLIPSYLIPSLNYLLKTGDTMSGNLNMNNNHILNVSSITAGYIYSNKYYGDGSNIQYISPNNLSSGDLPTNVNATAIKNGNYFNNVKVSSCIYSDRTGQAIGDNLGSHIATKTITADYGINASTIQVKNMLVYDSSAQPYIKLLGTNYLQNSAIYFATNALTNAWSLSNINTWNDAFVLRAKGTSDRIVVTQEGNVGIGFDSNPSEKLYVQGNIKAMNGYSVITSTLCLNGDCRSSWGSSSSGTVTSYSWITDDFTSQTDGSKTQFTLTYTPINNSLRLSKNGIILSAPNDYSLSGSTITMVTAPTSGSILVANYAISTGTETISTTTLISLNSDNTFAGNNTFTAQVNISSNLFITDGTQGSGKVLTSNANGLASWQDNLGEYTLIYGTYPASQGSEITLSSFSIVIPESFRANGVILLLEIEGVKMVNSGDLLATFNSDYTTIKPLTIHKTYVNTGVVWGITPVDYRGTYFLLTTNDFNTEQRVLIQAVFNYNHDWIMYKCKTVYASFNQYGFTEMGGGYMSNSAPTVLTLFRNGSVDFRIYKLQLKAKLK